MPPRASPTPIGRILRKYLRTREMDVRARQEQVRLSWAEIVGEVIAQVSSVERIADGVAYVSCATPVWAQTLSLRRKHILAKVAEHVGSNAIREIRFNSLPHSAADGSERSPALAPSRHCGRHQKALTESQEQTVAAIAASLKENIN